MLCLLVCRLVWMDLCPSGGYTNLPLFLFCRTWDGMLAVRLCVTGVARSVGSASFDGREVCREEWCGVVVRLASVRYADVVSMYRADVVLGKV